MNVGEMMIARPTDIRNDQHQRATVPFRFHLEYPKREKAPSTDDCTQGHGCDPGDWDTVEVHKVDVQEFDGKAFSRNDVLHTNHQLS